MERILWMGTFLVVIIRLAESKRCTIESFHSHSDEEPKFYQCLRNEYCCNLGCCVSPAFQFNQLWFYWLLVVLLMFLMCSGAGWWYRNWLTTRLHPEPVVSTLPVPRNPRRPRPRARASRPSLERPARDAATTHRLWKGPRIPPPPSYSPPHDPEMQQCPYYQLYGPPPSYESVVGHSSPKPDDEGTSCRIIMPPMDNRWRLAESTGPEHSPSSEVDLSQVNETGVPHSERAAPTSSPTPIPHSRSAPLGL